MNAAVVNLSVFEARPQTHFELFDLPVRFALDMRALEQAYRTVQAQVHPDRFAAAGAAQKRLATQWAAQANEAYQVLKTPLKRAIYLLHLQGIDVKAEDNTALDADFLMQQLTWREQIEEACAEKNSAELHTLLDTLTEEKRSRFQALADLLEALADEPTRQAAADAVRQLMFIERVLQEINRQLDELEQI